MKLNDELLSQIEQYSGLMFSKDEIASILELDSEEFINCLEDPQADKAFKKGRLLRDAELRKAIFDLAANGSSPAQAFAAKLIENAKMDDK